MSISDISQSFYKQGLKDEDFVREMTKEKWGGLINKATKLDDINAHIDFFWKKDETSEPIGFDVKGLRRNKRSGEFDENITWLELRAVNDRPGSIFGKAKYFAFITTKSIIYVERLKLIQLLKDKINDNELIELCESNDKIMTDEFIKNHNMQTSTHNLYEPHTRIYFDKDTNQLIKRLDVSVKVLMNDIRKINKQELSFS